MKTMFSLHQREFEFIPRYYIHLVSKRSGMSIEIRPILFSHIPSYLINRFCFLNDTHIHLNDSHTLFRCRKLFETAHEGYSYLRVTHIPFCGRACNVTEYNCTSILKRPTHDRGIDKHSFRKRISLHSNIVYVRQPPKRRNDD